MNTGEKRADVQNNTMRFGVVLHISLTAHAHARILAALHLPPRGGRDEQIRYQLASRMLSKSLYGTFAVSCVRIIHHARMVPTRWRSEYVCGYVAGKIRKSHSESPFAMMSAVAAFLREHRLDG